MQLTKRQIKAAKKLSRNGGRGGCVWWRVGQGKTRIAYKWFATIAKPRSIFVVICRREAFADWQEEATKCGLPWTVVNFETDLHMSGNIKVWLISHGMLSSLVAKILEYEYLIEAIAFDEGFLYKNCRSLHCKAAHILSKRIGKAAILSGSVMTARNIEDIFGQLYAVNQHDLVASTLTKFRSRYMTKFQIGANPQAIRWTGRKGAIELVSERCRKVVSINFPSDAARKIIEDVHRIDATPQQQDYIRRLKEEYYLKLKGKELELRNAPSLIIKCQQISDGWVKMNDGLEIEVPSAKLQYLISKVCELLQCGERVVIWCAFKSSVAKVLQSLQRLKLKCYGLVGGKAFDIAGWKRDGQVAVCTEASGSSINHFKDCPYAIYYSMDFAWLHLQQSQGRTNRFDSKHPTCYYYFLQTRGTLDSFVLNTARTSGEKEIELTKLNSWLAT